MANVNRALASAARICEDGSTVAALPVGTWIDFNYRGRHWNRNADSTKWIKGVLEKKPSLEKKQRDGKYSVSYWLGVRHEDEKTENDVPSNRIRLSTSQPATCTTLVMSTSKDPME